MPNIISEYKWTTTTGEYLEEAPRIWATAYKLSQNALLQAAKSYLDIVTTSGGTQYYENLHWPDEGTPEAWTFPFFGDELRSFNNSWGDAYTGSTNGSQFYGEGYLNNAVKAVADSALASWGQAQAITTGKAGALFEPPKYYSYNADDNAINIEFNLINTIDKDDYNKNYDIIKRLIKMNRFTRGDGLVTTPPVLWKVVVPGYRKIRWASCGVSVSQIGKRILKENHLIPEGFRVALVFTSLYTEPSNFMEEVDSI